MDTQTLTIDTADGAYHAFCALPPTDPAPAVIVLQEIFGVNDNIKDLCKWLAGEGYIAIAPDLFWRLEANVQLTDKTEAEWQRAFALMQDFDIDTGLKDIGDAITYARALPQSVGAQCAGKVGTMGFCLGGRLAYLAACRSDGDAHISYYGVGIEGALDEATHINAPTLLHIAAADQFVPPDAQRAIHDGLDAHPHITLYDYADANHAFAREGGAHYSAPAATLAHKRSLDLLAMALK